MLEWSWLGFEFFGRAQPRPPKQLQVLLQPRTVPLLHHCCTTTVILQYHYFTITVLPQYYYCTSVLLLYCYCTTTVLLLYYCTTTALLLHYFIFFCCTTHHCTVPGLRRGRLWRGGSVGWRQKSSEWKVFSFGGCLGVSVAWLRLLVVPNLARQLQVPLNPRTGLLLHYHCTTIVLH